MKKNRVSVIFDRLKRVSKTGRGTVEIKIYLSRNERKFFRVADIEAAEWPAFSQSAALKQQITKYEAIISSMEVLGKPMTLDSLNEFLGTGSSGKPDTQPVSQKKTERKSSSFIDFFHDELACEKIDLLTRRAREVVYRSIIDFGRIKHFRDLTPAMILDYDKWLRADNNRTDVTIKSYHKRLHRYVIKAFEYGYIDRDPYRMVTIPTGHSAERRPLTEEEIDRLRSVQLRGKEEKVRDLFIFSCFTGLCYCDAQAFDFGTMTEKQGDIYYIDGSRIKTGTNFYTPILPPAMEVLRMYNFRLPRMSNQKYNDYLHLIEARLKFNKPLTTHLARHTFATLVLSQGVPIENLARMLGHKDVRTTQVYAKILKKTIQQHAENLSKYFQ